METVTLDITTKELSRELLAEGYTKKIECKNYWDSHGKRVEWDPTVHKFDSEKKFEIWEVVRETHYPGIDYTMTSSTWHLYVDGEELNLGWIVEYNILKTKVKLDCCVGAG